MKTLETKDARCLLASLSTINHALFGSQVRGPIHMILEYAQFFFPRFVTLPPDILSTSLFLPDIEYLARKYHDGISLWEVVRHFTDESVNEQRPSYFTFPINTSEISGLAKWAPRVPVLFGSTDTKTDLCLLRMLVMRNGAGDQYDDPLKQRALINRSALVCVDGVPTICLGRPVPDAWPHIVAFAIPYINSAEQLGGDRLRPAGTDVHEYTIRYVDLSKTRNLYVGYRPSRTRSNILDELSWFTIPRWELETRLFNTIATHNHNKRVQEKGEEGGAQTEALAKRCGTIDVAALEIEKKGGSYLKR